LKIIDVTGTIENGMWEYGPPYPKVAIEQVCSVDDEPTIANYKVNAFRIALSTSSGTYIHAPAELIKGAPPIDQIPVDRFVREAAVLRFPRKKQPAEPITLQELRASKVEVKPGDAVIVQTGWEKMWNQPNFVTDSPYFSEEALDWILAKDISLLAGDLTVYDNFKQPTGRVTRIFQQGVLVLAPLVNLFRISRDRVKLIALPLKVKGASGCSCRAIVIEE